MDQENKKHHSLLEFLSHHLQIQEKLIKLDAYLHNLFTEITGIFGDTFEAVKNAVGGTSITL